MHVLLITGHLKRAFRLDDEHGIKSTEGANRTTTVVAGTVGLTMAGPAGAIVAGAATGVSIDATKSSVVEEKPAPWKLLT